MLMAEFATCVKYRLPVKVIIVRNDTLDEALRHPGPVIVEAIVDQFEPPMPAKVTLKQTTNFAKALLRWEPNRERIALTLLSDTVRELV